jgi:thiaminase/transcriptional activator TenA
MTTRELIADDAELWHAATHHPFLDAVRNGTLDPAAFSRWLVQDHHFALALTRAEGRYLANAPRRDLELLGQGIQAMVAELAWFERNAAERGLDLATPLHPTVRAYVDCLHAAIAALLARGEALVDAVREAKDFISRAIAGAPGVGRGHGPVDHSA